MNDVAIILSATGNLDAKLEALNKKLGEMASNGKKIGPSVEKGLEGTLERMREMQREFHKFMLAGALVYKGLSAAADIWSGAHQRALQRVNQANRESFEQQRRQYQDQVKAREQSWANTNMGTVIRMAGVQDAGAGAGIMTSLNELQGPIGDAIRNRLFPQIAQAIAGARLSSDDTERALQQAAGGLNKFGHVPGFGDAYADLAGSGMAGRGDLTQLALGMSLRRARMTSAEQGQLSKGLAAGEISVGDDGMLGGKGDSAAIAKLINGMGGFGLQRAFEGWNPAAGGRLSGVHAPARAGDESAYVLPEEFRRAMPTAPVAPKDATDAPTQAGDWLAAAWGSPAVQQAIATAMTIGIMTAWARVRAAGALGDMVRPPGGPGLPGAPGGPGPGGGKPAGGGRGGWGGLGGRVAGWAGAAALVAGSIWGAVELAGSTDAMQDAKKGPSQDELLRRRALKVAQTVSTGDDDALRAQAAAGDPDAGRVAQLLEAILTEMRKGNAANWDVFPLAPMAEAQ